MFPFTPGDPVPWFRCRSPVNPSFDFGTVAGRVIVLTFIGSAATPAAQAVVSAFHRYGDLFDDFRASHFLVTVDPTDESEGRLQERIPGFRLFYDFDGKVSQRFGVLDLSAKGEKPRYTPLTCVIDANLRLVGAFPIDQPGRHAAQVCQFVVEQLPALPRHVEAQPGLAPVLLVPRVFEPEFCRELINYYERAGGEDSGFMVGGDDGMARLVVDHNRKKRADVVIEDKVLADAMRARISRRLVPEIKKAFQFNATRIERYIIACYDGGEGGYFSAHRDNTTKATAHRKFACSINLNAGEYEGGNLVFPEFGPQQYRPPTGGACVFSCSLMHEAMPVTRGRRYCTLPFLYDEEGARVRAENLGAIADPELREGVTRSVAIGRDGAREAKAKPRSGNGKERRGAQVPSSSPDPQTAGQPSRA